MRWYIWKYIFQTLDAIFPYKGVFVTKVVKANIIAFIKTEILRRVLFVTNPPSKNVSPCCIVHWLPLSLAHSLTPWRLVDLIDVTLACEYANSKLVEVFAVAEWKPRKAEQWWVQTRSDCTLTNYCAWLSHNVPLAVYCKQFWTSFTKKLTRNSYVSPCLD